MTPRAAPRRALRRGLTLIELAVVMALLVTLVTLALPQMADTLARHRLRAAAEALAGELAEARFAAAQRQQPMHVGFAAGADWCWVVATASPCDCRVPQACRVRAQGAAQFKGVELMAFEDAQFDPTGRGSGHADLRSSRGHVLRAEVGPTGRPRVCAPAAVVPGVQGC